MWHFYENQLKNYALKRSLRLPEYSLECNGPPHASHFRCKVTVDGRTFESPEFFSTKKGAENAAAKVALTSLVPDGAKEDNSGLFKNLLQELVQKEGFPVPEYDTNRSGEGHEAIFVSTVKIIREVFEGPEARTKKQAEMNAAEIAYTTLKELSTEVSLNQPSILSSGPDIIITCNRGSSVDASYGYASDTLFSTPSKSENGLSSHSSTNLVMDSSLVPPAETIISSCKRIFVHPRLPNMTIPKGYTILPKSDDKWVVFSPN
nr:double-stranded RNA-binding protein 4-like [Quercus suber]